MEILIHRTVREGKASKRTGEKLSVFQFLKDLAPAQCLRVGDPIGYHGSGRLMRLPSDLVIGVRIMKIDGQYFALVQMDPLAPLIQNTADVPLAKQISDAKRAVQEALTLFGQEEGNTPHGHDYLVPIDPSARRGSFRINKSNLFDTTIEKDDVLNEKELDLN